MKDCLDIGVRIVTVAGHFLHRVLTISGANFTMVDLRVSLVVLQSIDRFIHLVLIVVGVPDMDFTDLLRLLIVQHVLSLLRHVHSIVLPHLVLLSLHWVSGVLVCRLSFIWPNDLMWCHFVGINSIVISLRLEDLVVLGSHVLVLSLIA